MEACFLSSKSLTKTTTTDLALFLKSKLFHSSKKHTFYPHNSKLGVSSSKICCQLGSSSSNEEGSKPIISGDWRSFRAKLVATERISTPDSEHPSSINTDPPNLNLEDKWAHPIHEPEKGCLLIATEKLDGVHIFERTVVLLLSNGPLGPTGIILNRPSLMSIKETKSTVLDSSGTFSEKPLFFGGPLQGGLFIVRSPIDEEDGVSKSGVFEEVMKGVHYGTRETVGCAAEMVKRNVVGLGDIKFFDGYCGWEKEQLQEEVRAGYWNLAACSPNVLGLESMNSGGMWEEILGLMDPRQVW